MISIYCDVIGCMSTAKWERKSPVDADLHDYLCEAHFEMLIARNSAAAAGYGPANDEPVAEQVAPPRESPERTARSPETARNASAFNGCRTHLASYADATSHAMRY